MFVLNEAGMKHYLDTLYLYDKNQLFYIFNELFDDLFRYKKGDKKYFKSVLFKTYFYRLNLVKSQKAYNHHFYEKWLIKFLFFREVILVQSWINRHRSLCKSLKSSTTKSFLRAWFFAATTSYTTVKLANLR